MRSTFLSMSAVCLLLMACSSESTPAGETCGAGKQGEPCASATDCDCGFSCKKDNEGDFVCQKDPDTGGTTEGGTTEGTTEGGTTEGTTTGGGTTGGDINAGCGKNAPDGALCNPYCQNGCSADQNCTFQGGSFGCGLPGAGGIGDGCTNSSNCATGLACISLTGDPAGPLCRQFCIDESECPEGRACDLNVTFSGGAAASFCGDISVGCNAFDQSTCGDGQGCYLNNNATKCFEAGTLKEGEACIDLGPNSCEAGLQCLIVCTPVCSFIDVNGDEPKCTEFCAGASFQAVNDDNGIGVCLTDTPPSECDIFAQEGCGAGEGCYMTNTGWRCFNAGKVEIGEQCEFTNDCVPGGICINSQCQEICSVKEAAPAKDKCDEKCGAFNQVNPSEWEVGFCTDAEPAVPCDFWAQDCVDAGTACYFVSNGATCLTAGTGGSGASCSSVNDCMGGLYCYQGKCSEVCSINEFQAGASICIDDCPESKFESVSLENQVGICSQ